MNSEKLRTILTKYERRRDNNDLELKIRKEEIYAKIPEIEELDNEINKIGLQLARLVLTNPKDSKSIVDSCKDKIAVLKNRKIELLERFNIPKNYLELKYSCNVCKDKGFIESGEKCNCLKQEIINECYKMSNLDRILSKENFSNFNLDVFSPSKGDSQISPRENMLNILSICEKFIMDFKKDNGENLLFYGTTGLGKTYMCNCIAKDLLDKGFTVVYQTSFKILEILEDYKFKRDSNNKLIEENYRNLFDCDLLIIDDLGTELTNSFTTSEIFNIVNTRLVSGKKILISTNLSPSQLGSTYTQRTLSRILDKFRMIRFMGDDLRWETSKNK